MSEINTISLLNQMQAMAAKSQGQSVENTGSSLHFGDVFQKALGNVNALDQQAEGLKTRFELGDNKVGIGEVMVATQKASLALQATLSVRNKLVSVYQDMMNMPV